MEENKLVPNRRFKEFELDWKEKNFELLAETVRGASPRPIEDPKWFDSHSNIGWLRISDVTSQNGRITNLKQKMSLLGQQKTRVIKNSHLLLSIAATVGKPVINYVETGVHDGFLIFFKPKFDIEYMYQWLEMFRPKWQQYGQPGSQVNLNSAIVKKHIFLIPEIEEQQKIGTFFKVLDKRIANQERKVAKVKALKSAYLTEMFAQEGETVPKRRFKGFEGEWNTYILKDVIEYEFKGKTNAIMFGGNTPYLETEYLNGGKKSFVNVKADTKKNDVLILWDGSKAGTVYHGFQGALGSTLKVYKPKYSGSFLYYYLKKYQELIFLKYRTPNIPHVINTFTEEFKIIIPTMHEQQKIGQFFKNLDNQIEMEEKKLKKLQKMKQAYLEEMFV